ncbi:hypothetical protein SK128_004697 [Halocaridina rubra]|uniref:Uncharacterized protein n=1 Tax=Halocaridina rubra TaxID=373956 RepID=A0AAN8X9Q6_HALRR
MKREFVAPSYTSTIPKRLSRLWSEKWADTKRVVETTLEDGLQVPNIFLREEFDGTIVERQFKKVISPHDVWLGTMCHHEYRCLQEYHLLQNSCQTLVQDTLAGVGIRITTWRDYLPVLVGSLLNYGMHYHFKGNQ